LTFVGAAHIFCAAQQEGNFSCAHNFQPGIRQAKEYEMINGIDDFQKMGQANFDAATKSFGEVNKGLQGIATEVTDYSKKAFEDGTQAIEKMVGAKSLEQAFEIQTTFAKTAYDNYVAEFTKLSEMYVDLAKEAYKPVETAITKKV
jgi:phasin family protein